MSQKIKVMVVDDTITYRQIMSKVVETFAEADLVGTASSGRTALMKIPSLKPDLVFLDVMMPEMDGIETLKAIKKDFPHTQVVMVSAFDMENAKATINSLENGALDFVAKPQAKDMADGIKQLTDSLRPVIEVVRAKMGVAPPPAKPKIPPRPVDATTPRTATSPQKFNMVVLGISTGGPNALHTLFSKMTTVLPVPVFIVQHMPPMFTQSLAERLNSVSPMSINEAVDGEEAQPGHVYIAPGGKHMLIKKKGLQTIINITDTPPVNHCKPAVDVLFRSVTGISDAAPLSVIMTGMGRDGTDGVRTLKRFGTYTLIQDEPSSVVWGMPGSISDAELADEVLALEAIGDRIVALTKQ